MFANIVPSGLSSLLATTWSRLGTGFCTTISVIDGHPTGAIHNSTGIESMARAIQDFWRSQCLNLEISRIQGAIRLHYFHTRYELPPRFDVMTFLFVTGEL
ncbi:hypothetical protein GGS26DRAFT_547091, partial [Hypomontagnella submonticulosa]